MRKKANDETLPEKLALLEQQVRRDFSLWMHADALLCRWAPHSAHAREKRGDGT